MANYLVIGGSSGIGREITLQLNKLGHQVYATFCKNEQSSFENVIYFRHNVLEETLSTEQLPTELDGVVYCVGSIHLKPFKRFSAEEMLTDYRLQVVGAMETIKVVYKLLKKSSQASIVLFSTVAVQQGFPFHAQVSASKGAIEGLTRTLSAELAPTIRVNAIAPSLTDTPLAGKLLTTPEKKEINAQRNPLKRVGEAVDVANMATFLLGNQSSWITGQIFGVDGGQSSIA